jgi:NitT/TauT family transport system ATP-binding protein
MMDSARAVIPIEAQPPLAAAKEATAPTRPATGKARGMLSLRNIWKIFPGSRVPILSDITLECRPGEFVVVVGPSGSGKTTLLTVAAGMALPERGSVCLDGESVKSPGPQRAMVFQEHGLFPWLTAEQNVAFGLKMAGVPNPERDERVAAALRMVHLSGSGRKLVHQLSGGMRQRIAIARALVMDPAVLLMDEPFASLDAQTRTLLHQQLQDLWCQTKKTILFVTHSVGEAVRLADRIIVLHAHPGRIRAEIGVNLPHPRQLDSPAMSELARRVRKEIEDEVNRVNAAAQEFWQPPSSVDLDSGPGGMGDGI